MADDRHGSSLLLARDNYVRKYAHMVESYVLGVFDQMYVSVQKLSLKTFQAKLREVQEWNSSTIKHHADQLSIGCDCLDEMIAALFVSQVKVLTSIRLTSQKKSVTLKIPANEDYVHRYFIEVARLFYENPYMFRQHNTRAKRAVLVAAVDEAVNKLLPHRKILRACLGDFLSEDRSFDTFEAETDKKHDHDNRSEDNEPHEARVEDLYADLPPPPFEQPPQEVEQQPNPSSQFDDQQYEPHDPMKTVQVLPNPQNETIDQQPFTKPVEPQGMLPDPPQNPTQFDYNDLFRNAGDLP
jgi:hypothetical protein